MPKSDSTALGIPGDGRCLFRSVVHGACLRSGKPSPSESLEKELADELRAKVADEFIKRRRDTEWFLEDDFDTYVGQMRQPHVWGGEPELLMSSHVLKLVAGYLLFQTSESCEVSVILLSKFCYMLTKSYMELLLVLLHFGFYLIALKARQSSVNVLVQNLYL
ncbi:OVARIAN TUMOR DOMAIN-containing deubiquitinating enzyme 4 isoform X3 [Manihot esculenta]|uniref:OVARIAN TUMOR DOMAIN-containing deubiquitinating enzyme 4 isoform X3 n=1 Tax=Manihot esculenta TaxID=3983 RepID=UPI001CC62B13|nr:OVARIAN TUMOR DOMAIN-containing deubiquitinating enzyme 4 isoform X3 [Manihot esculenta]